MTYCGQPSESPLLDCWCHWFRTGWLETEKDALDLGRWIIGHSDAKSFVIRSSGNRFELIENEDKNDTGPRALAV